MNTSNIRTRNLKSLKKLGYEISPGAPPLISLDEISPKTTSEISERSMALFCVLAVIFDDDFDDTRTKVWEWVEANSLAPAFTEEELIVFDEKSTKQTVFDIFWGRQESLYALCWGLGLVEEIDRKNYLPDSFGQIFPNIDKGRSAQSFYDKCKLRDIEKLVAETDFWYCLHWLGVDQQVTGSKWVAPIGVATIRNRRKALEWIVAGHGWDDVPLDT